MPRNLPKAEPLLGVVWEAKVLLLCPLPEPGWSCPLAPRQEIRTKLGLSPIAATGRTLGTTTSLVSPLPAAAKGGEALQEP